MKTLQESPNEDTLIHNQVALGERGHLPRGPHPRLPEVDVGYGGLRAVSAQPECVLSWNFFDSFQRFCCRF